MPTWFFLTFAILDAVGFFCLGYLWARQPVEDRIEELINKGYALGKKHAAEAKQS